MNVLLALLSYGAAFMPTMCIAGVFGYAAQGRYSELRYWVDLLAVCFSFGLPQAVFRLRTQYPPPVILRAAYQGLAMVGAATLVMYALQLMLPVAWVTAPRLIAALAGVCVCALLLLRAVMLAQGRLTAFQLTGILFPAVIVALPFAVGGRHTSSEHFSWMLLAAGLISAALTHLIYLRTPPGPQLQAPPPKSTDIWFAAKRDWAQQVLAFLYPVGLVATLRLIGSDDRAIGFASVTLFLITLSSAPAAVFGGNIVATLDKGQLQNRIKNIPIRLFGICGLIYWLALSQFHFWYPHQFSPHWVIVLAILPITALMRMGTPMLIYGGASNTLLRAEVFRAMGVVLMLFLGGHTDSALVWALVAGELAAASTIGFGAITYYRKNIRLALPRIHNA